MIPYKNHSWGRVDKPHPTRRSLWKKLILREIKGDRLYNRDVIIEKIIGTLRHKKRRSRLMGKYTKILISREFNVSQINSYRKVQEQTHSHVEGE